MEYFFLFSRWFRLECDNKSFDDDLKIFLFINKEKKRQRIEKEFKASETFSYLNGFLLNDKISSFRGLKNKL